MMRGAILAVATLIALSQTATAGVPLFGNVSCAVVRFYVAKYSEGAAEKWARSHGASDAEIETARRCLHTAKVQTANLSAKSQALAPVAEQVERAQHEPAERDPDQDTLHVAPAQDQHQRDPEQDNHDNVTGVNGFIRATDEENRSTAQLSSEVKQCAPSDAKTTTSRPYYAGAMHRARTVRVTGHATWFKRLWDHLVGRRRSSIALFAIPPSRSYKKTRLLWYHLSETAPGHRAA